MKCPGRSVFLLCCFLLFHASVGGAAVYDTSLDRAVANILTFLYESGSIPRLDISNEILLRHELSISISMEKPDHYDHLVTKWQTPASGHTHEHLETCHVCALVLKILRNASSVELLQVPLNAAQARERASYEEQIWSRQGYLKPMNPAEARRWIQVVEKLLNRIVRCRAMSGECTINQDVAALAASNSELENDLGALYLQINDREKSMLHIKRALRIDDRQAHLHYNLGELYWQGGLEELASLHWEAGLSLVGSDDPQQKARLMRKLASTYQNNPRLSSAEACEYARHCTRLEEEPRRRSECSQLMVRTCP